MARPSTSRQAGFSLMEIIVVVAVIVLLSVIVGPRVLSWIDEGKIAHARGDEDAISAAMNHFFQDTTRWPGQAEILRATSTVRFLIVGDPATATLPTFGVPSGIGAATCSSGLAGVIPNVTAFGAATPSASNSLNVLDFLVRQPSATDYPNWRGPYLPTEFSSDPWDRAYVINIIPLFCGEAVTATLPGGALGFAWMLSAGPNRTIQTLFTDVKIAADSDDVGVNLSKRVTHASP